MQRPGPRGHNRGPAAADRNRQALLDAAEQLFADKGYGVALSAVARAAGVGQGSLYRHFPTRGDLASAVVSRRMERLRAVAAEHPGPDGFGVLWDQVMAMLVDSGGFLEAALGPRGEVDGIGPSQELAALLDRPLAVAVEAGLVEAGLVVSDLMLVVAMVHGALRLSDDASQRRTTARRALALVGRGLDTVGPS